MADKRIGLHIDAGDSNDAVKAIQRAEELGITAAWLTSGAVDPLTIIAGAAVRTEKILLGTSIVPIWPLHPICMAQQALVLDQLSSNRFRLGVGPSGRAGMVQTYGADFRAPLGHLREYVHILKALLQNGKVDMEGRYYTAHAHIDEPLDLPVMASALQQGSYHMCGAEADGAISWVCPGPYLRDVALPAMRAGAEEASRTMPPLIAHAPVSVHENADEVRQAVRERLGGFARSPFYARMFVAAGFPEVASRTWSDNMVDAVALYGDEGQLAEKLQELLSFGATEVIASIIPAGPDQQASQERTLNLLAQVAQSL